jgi:hypothetical protein
MLNGKRGLHLVVLYIVIGERRIPWSFRVWRGKGQPSPNQLACKLLASVPKALVKGRTVIVQADTEFGTIEFLNAARQHQWRAVVGVKNSRLLLDGRKLKDLPGTAKRGLQVYLKDIDYPLTLSWFWLKRADDKRELRFVVSTHPYSGVYLVRLGRKRWAIVELALLAEWAFSRPLSISSLCIALAKARESACTVGSYCRSLLIYSPTGLTSGLGLLF